MCPICNSPLMQARMLSFCPNGSPRTGLSHYISFARIELIEHVIYRHGEVDRENASLIEFLQLCLFNFIDIEGLIPILYRI